MRWVLGVSLLMAVSLGACGGSTTRGTLPPDGGSGAGGSGAGGSGAGGSGAGGSSTGGTGGVATCEQYVNVVNKVSQNPSGACASCVINAQSQSSSPCYSLVSATKTDCPANSCQSCGSDGGTIVPATTCSCYKGCASATCWSTSIDLMQCILDQCSSSC